MFSWPRHRRRLVDLSEAEILALAVSSEEEDRRLYLDYAEHLRKDSPRSAKMLEEVAAVEDDHRRRLIELYRKRFGDHLPLVRRADVAGFPPIKPLWTLAPKGPAAVRGQAAELERCARAFYEKAASLARDAPTRKLLGDLATEEADHIAVVGAAEDRADADAALADEDEAHRRRFLLQYVQPGLAGLMDGSVSTLAPLFAAAFATQNSWSAFLVGMAASIGAGISMGFAEALSDDGALTGRGSPIIRGTVTGAMTIIGGVGHTLPYLISSFYTATALAIAVVAVELFAIAWIRWRYMDTPFLSATFQIVFGGALVFAGGHPDRKRLIRRRCDHHSAKGGGFCC